MTDESETVWVLPRTDRYETQTVHTHRDCWGLRHADRDPVEACASDYYETQQCQRQRCANVDADFKTQRPHPPNLEDRLETRQAIYDALAEADGPLSSREIALEALLSDEQIKRALPDLIELGQIERVENPDDGRIPLYRLASMCPTGPQRGRAQITPVGLGVLTLVFCLLWLLAIAVASGVIAP